MSMSEEARLARLAKKAARKRERYATDPEYKARMLARGRARVYTPEQKAQKLARRRERLRTDPVFREKQRARSQKYNRIRSLAACERNIIKLTRLRDRLKREIYGPEVGDYNPFANCGM